MLAQNVAEKIAENPLQTNGSGMRSSQHRDSTS